MTSYDLLAKIVLVGDSGVGKSSLILRFTASEFTFDSQSTVGVEFCMKTIALDNNVLVKAQIWDTAGQERYHAMTKAYYRGAVGAMVVFDTTQRATFESIQRWRQSLHQAAGESVSILIVGSKCDLAAQREVSAEEATGLAKSLGALYTETSAKEDVGVDAAFNDLVTTIAKRLAVRANDDDVPDVFLEHVRLDDLGAAGVAVGGGGGGAGARRSSGACC